MTPAQRIQRIARVKGWPTPGQLLFLDVTFLTLTWGVSWTVRFEGLRWMDSWGDAALVNLAAFELQRVQFSVIVERMNVVVGAASTQTPEFSDEIWAEWTRKNVRMTW